MQKPKVFVTRKLPDEWLGELPEHADVVVWQEETPPARSQLLQEVADCEGLLAVAVKVDVGLLEAAPRLRVVANYGVGYDNVDVAAATARGIAVGYTPGVLTEATADLSFALILSIARRVAESERFLRAGRWNTWSPRLLFGADLFGATLGIVGLGRIGKAVARRSKGFNMRVLYYDIKRYEAAELELGAEPVTLEQLLQESRFVSIHCSFTPQTYHLIGARELSLMGRDSYLINVARGPVVDEAALCDALRSGKIRGAALDVMEEEPLPKDSPLLTFENVVLTPHIGSATETARSAMARLSAENLIAGLQGRPLPQCVNPEVQVGR